MTNNIVQHRKREEVFWFRVFINQELCQWRWSVHSYLNDTTGANNFSEKDVENYLNNVTTKKCGAHNNQIRMLLDSGANFFAFHPKD